MQFNDKKVVLLLEHKTFLSGEVVFPNDSRYLQARMNWDPFTNEFPLVFVFARQEEDVVNAVKWARENHVPIRVRSGRHALAKDLSQVSGGIVIDVSNMQNVTLDKEHGIATVQTGIRVGALVRMLAQEGHPGSFRRQFDCRHWRDHPRRGNHSDPAYRWPYLR